MKKITFFIYAIFFVAFGFAQQVHTNYSDVDKAFALAVKTLRDNTSDNLIKAGGAYGGEWTRDISINAWNVANLISPVAAQYSMWSVTTDNRSMIGHQYWDQVLWVIAAYDYYLTNNDLAFLKQAYIASSNTMAKLEKEAYDPKYGLFTGPSVFNDGIAGYEEPIYESGVGSTYILDYPASKTIKCLSTNCLYVGAYQVLAKMADVVGDKERVKEYTHKATVQRDNVRTHLYDAPKGWLNYLIDQNGDVHQQQEALGVAFAILFDVVDKTEARRIISQVYISEYGIPSVYPCFKRFSQEQPGRHNVMIWPFVNSFWANACLKVGEQGIFEDEFKNLANLAINKSNSVFYEIYNEQTGEQDGGWQIGTHWTSIHNQTWSATGYLSMMFRGVLGISACESGLAITPDVQSVNDLGFKELRDLQYQSGTINIKVTGSGKKIDAILIDGKKSKQAFVKTNHTGLTTIEFKLK